jgi:hypothetical protein
MLSKKKAHATVEDGVLLLTHWHQLIGQSNPGAVRISDELANLNEAIAYAKANGRNFSMSQGYSLHPDGTLTEHTIENTVTRAYTEIGGLDDGRPMFAIVSFDGVLKFTADGRLYYRVGTHLHRYTLLDVATEHNSSFQVIRQRAHRAPSGGNSAATPTLRQRYSESPSSQQSTSPPNFPVPVQGPPGR